MTDETNKRLHFIVRDAHYSHCLGYGYFLNQALVRLNGEHPTSARAVLEQTALYLLNPADEQHLSEAVEEQPKNIQRYLACLPEELRRNSGIDAAFFNPKNEEGNAHLQRVFGPAARTTFGLLTPRKVEYTEKMHRGGGVMSSRGLLVQPYSGSALTTAIYSTDADAPLTRNYFAPLAEHYGLSAEHISEDFYLAFDYPIPGSDEKLPLMQIGSPQRLKYDYLSHYSGQFGEPNVHFRTPAIKLLFLHPNCTRAFFESLLTCMEPLWQQLNVAPAEPVAPGSAPPAEKMEAMATLYWLLAQSTPIVGGGSAYANVILEHMAERLRGQGYDCEIPYVKAGTDLWAQAATLPLDDQPQLQGFKSRFCAGKFFDRATTDHEMDDYLRTALEKVEIKAARETAINRQMAQVAWR